MLDKRSLRLAIKQRFAEFDPVERRRETSLLLHRVARLPNYADARTILFFVGHLAEELPTRSLIVEALRSGRRVICPRVVGRSSPLRLSEIRDASVDLRPGTLGIPEPRPDLLEVAPAEIEWALIPGLAFDRHCNRLGRGAGHYDRLLPLLPSSAPRWAVAYSIQLVDAVPTESHDVPLDGVLGPETTWRRDDPQGDSTVTFGGAE